MRALFAALLLLALACAPACASPRLRLLHVSALPTSETVTFGDQTPARYGGAALNANGPTTPLTIVSQTTSGAFCLLDNTLVWCGASYGGARTVTTPTVGNDAYEVTVQNTRGDIEVVVVNVVAHRYDIAPTPDSVGDTAANFQLGHLASAPLFCGDQIVGRAGNYNVGNGTGGVTAKTYLLPVTATRTQRGGGPACPTQPHVEGVAEDSTNNGWVSVTCEVALACKMGGTNLTWEFDRLPIDATNCPLGGCLYMSFRGWLYSGLGLTHIANSTNHVEAWLEYGDDEFSVTVLSTTYTTGQNHHIFFHDNYLHDNGTGFSITLYACDSQVIGNVIDGNKFDAIHHAIFNCTYGSHYSQISWNFVRNKKATTATNTHNDMDQAAYTSQTAPKMVAVAGDYEGPQEIGNIFVRGNGSSAAGVAWEDGQCIFHHDLPTGVRLRSYVMNNICIGVMANGIQLDQAAPGTEVGFNSMILDHAAGTLGSGQGPPRLRVGVSTSAAISSHDNFLEGPANYNGTTPPAPTPVESNNVYPVASLGSYITAPAPGAAVQSIAAVIAAFTPINGTVLHPSGQHIIGAVNTYCDFVARTCSFPP